MSDDIRVRVMLSRARIRERFRFTQQAAHDDRFYGAFVVGLDYTLVGKGNGWKTRFDPTDKIGWKYHWVGSRDRPTRAPVPRYDYQEG